MMGLLQTYHIEPHASPLTSRCLEHCLPVRELYPAEVMRANSQRPARWTPLGPLSDPYHYWSAGTSILEVSPGSSISSAPYGLGAILIALRGLTGGSCCWSCGHSAVSRSLVCGAALQSPSMLTRRRCWSGVSPECCGERLDLSPGGLGGPTASEGRRAARVARLATAACAALLAASALSAADAVLEAIIFRVRSSTAAWYSGEPTSKPRVSDPMTTAAKEAGDAGFMAGPVAPDGPTVSPDRCAVASVAAASASAAAVIVLRVGMPARVAVVPRCVAAAPDCAAAAPTGPVAISEGGTAAGLWRGCGVSAAMRLRLRLRRGCRATTNPDGAAAAPDGMAAAPDGMAAVPAVYALSRPGVDLPPAAFPPDRLVAAAAAAVPEGPAAVPEGPAPGANSRIVR